MNFIKRMCGFRNMCQGVTLRCLVIWPAVDKMLQEADVAKLLVAVNCSTVVCVVLYWGEGHGESGDGTRELRLKRKVK